MPLAFSNSLNNALTNKISPLALTPVKRGNNLVLNSTTQTSTPAAILPTQKPTVQQPINKPAQQTNAPAAPSQTFNRTAITPFTQASAQPLGSQSAQQPIRRSGLYPTLVGSLAAQGLGNPATSGIVQNLTNMGKQPDWQTINGTQYNTQVAGYDPVGIASKNLQEFNTKYAGQVANTEGLPLGVEEQTGRAASYARQAAATQGALQQEVANLLQGQQQRIGALGTAGGIANTQQGLIQQALQQAGALAAPQLSQYGQTYYSPVEGGASGGQGVSPNDPFYQTMQTYAQLLANNQGGTIPASITGNSVLNAQLQQMAKAINPGYNYNVASGVGAAQQSNAQIAGTAGVAANQAVLNPAYANYLQLQQTTQNIDQFGGLLTQTMQQGGINPFDLKYANKTLTEIRNQLSSGQQAIYDNTLATLRSRVSGLLAAGGSEVPSAITADAQKILDGSLPLSSLTGVLQRIQQEGQILLNNAAGVVNTAYAGVQGGNTQQNATTNSNSIWSW